MGGLRGLHIDRPTTDTLPNGIAFDYGGQFGWGMGLDATLNYPGVPDLVLAYSRDTNADNLRMRSDDARTALGPAVGHPVLPFQLSIEPGPNVGGLAIGCHSYQYGLYLYNRGPTRRNNLNFQNLFAWITDTNLNGTGDLSLYNYQTKSPVISVAPAGDMIITSPKLGFFGASCVSKPTVGGSWSDGSAARNVLAALVQLGLVNDATTP
jgi:hypothetical protein